MRPNYFLQYSKHKKGERAGEFRQIHCSSVPAAQLEDELFGQLTETSPGKYKEVPGLLEKANNGTVLFNEIGDLPMQLQAKLLQFIEEKRISAIKTNKEKKLDVKLIFSSSKDLEKEITEGNFNAELYDRISDFIISHPPLRERKEDIKELAKYFYVTECKKIKKEPYGISLDALGLLGDHSWPGNTRELHKVIKRCVVKLGDKEEVTRDLVIAAMNANKILLDNIPQESEKIFEEIDDRPLRISDSLSIINDVFRIIQECGPVRKSNIVEQCPLAEKSFHHWINLLKEKYQVIMEDKAGNFKVYAAVAREVLNHKLKTKILSKPGDLFMLVEL